ncbi:MAG: carbohydrate binding family 9 domain-containing protein [candidate division Zixibacteria bacterium]|nr:carbohydrate binding family 9 domain-containing protein [candidate division Zixibacteria bacterium]
MLAAPTLCLLLAGSASAEHLSPPPRKQMAATRIHSHSPDVDGRLDDSCWAEAVMVSDFMQKEPNEGTIPKERTLVGFLYDDDALYVGARMYSDNPTELKKYLNRHDSPGSSEQIIISLDTYLDRRTCYDFGVSDAGVRFDRYHPVDNEEERDFSYNPVWEAQAQLDSLGWTAEMRIPFSQLRFNRQDVQVWGANLNRWKPAHNEDDFWIYVPRNETGWSSRFGDLIGISGIRPSRRIELLPYVTGDSRFTSNPTPGDPLDDGSVQNSRVGGDLKMGMGPNLTLDATINPDFGQVDADPARVNLSAYETYFDERRPFFIEGSQLLQVDGPSYFYSRRIGGPPHGEADGDFVSSPNATTILGAGKLTGRLSSGTSVGVLGAVTSRERARVYDSTTHHESRTTIEPATGYGVLRLQQEFGHDASTVGLLLTDVERGILPGDGLAGILRQRAITGGADWTLRFQGGKYDLIGYAGFSHVEGDTAAIRQTQESSTHYFQRPDAPHVSVDPKRTSLSGATASLRGGKRSGRHWLWGGGFSLESPGFELNDAGILSSADDIDSWGHIRYRETNPGPLWRNYGVEVDYSAGWNFAVTHKYTELNLNLESTWKRFWSTYVNAGRSFRGMSDDLTRGGPLMATSASWFVETGVNSNYSAPVQYGGSVTYGRNEIGGWEYDLSGRLSSRAGERWSLSVSPVYSRSQTTNQYVATLDSGTDATDGQRYVFAHIQQSRLSAQFRVSYFFNPDLSLEVYAEPFAASGRYYDFGELRAARTNDIRLYGTDGTTITPGDDGVYQVTDANQTFKVNRSDFGDRSFRSNVVLRWELHRGSTLYVIWQQNRSADENPGMLVGPRSVWRSLKADGNNLLAIKFSYWLPLS